MNKDDIAGIFQSFKEMKALIVGDVMIDSYVWGSVDRISPEAPVPVIRVRKKEIRLGGAANVALNIQALDAAPIVCSVIGDDSDGEALLDLLNRSGISVEGIVRSRYRITTNKERYMSGSQHLLRVDNEMDGDLNASDQEELLFRIRDLVPKCDVVIFQDYDKGVLNPIIISKTIAYAAENNIPVVVDPKKRNFLSYKNVSLFKPNLKEIREGLKIDFDPGDNDQLQRAVCLLKEKLQAEAALLTLSDKGVYIDDGREKILIPAHLRSISDVSGAGDTVISIAALCVALRLPSQFLAELSNLGGGLVCEHVGVVPVDRNALFREAVQYLSK